MTRYIWCEQLWQIAIAFVATGGVIFNWNSAVAQVVPDNTLGAESSVVTPNVDIKGLPSDRIDGGAVRGANLFHSFQEFGVRDGRGVYFSNLAGVENIFSRVTGTNPSNIFGKLGVLGSANLFLLNPNGIIFGPNASLDIGGSFVGSTANSLNFGNGQQFSATNPTAPPLLTVTVPLGVQFNQAQPSAIVNSGNLLAGTGQNLTLLGGTVVSTGQLSAPGGQVAVAAVPGGSVVNLSPSGQLLNIETPSLVSSVGSSSVTELLRSVDEKSRPGLTVNSNGQVELTGSGLPVVDGDVVARNVTAKTATLTANHNLTLVESQLGTTGDLNLLAGDTVRVRDSVANPFVAKAGGNLTIRGDKGIDILALNHPQTPFVSGENLSLVSDGNISGDARFSSGGRFSILNLAAQPGNFVSLYDPIISADGDVQFGDYRGAALKVESTGRIIGGNITITSSDPLAPNPSNPNPRYPDDVGLLRNSRAVILRAGLDSLDYAVNIPTSVERTNFNFSGASPLPPGSIQVGNIDTSSSTFESNAGPMMLSATGNITTGNIRSIFSGGDSNSNARAGNIGLDAGGNITVGGNIEAYVARQSRGQGGNITLISNNGNIDTSQGFVSSVTTNGQSGNIKMAAPLGNITTANIFSFIGAGGTGRGGSITLRSGVDDNGNASVGLAPGVGIINTTRVINAPDIPKGIYSAVGEIGVAGDVTLTAAGNIFSGDIQAFSRNNLPNRDFISTISINSLGGTVFIDNARLNTTNTGNSFAGDILINGRNIQANNSQIESRGVVGRIDLIANGGRVTISDSMVDTQTINRVTTTLEPTQGEGIKIKAGEIQINKSRLTAQTNSEAPPGSITLDAAASIDITNNSNILSTISANAGGQQVANYTPTITLKGSSVNITNNSEVNASTSGIGNAGNIDINARQTVTFDNGFAFATVEKSGIGKGGDIRISIPTGSLFVRNGAQLQALTNGQGNAGKIDINARDTVTFDRGFAFTKVVTTGVGKAGEINISIPNGSLSLTNGAQLQSDTTGQGNAGKITINARDSISISGTNPTSGQSSALFTDTESADFAGDDIIIGNVIKPNLFRISDGAVLVTSTSNSGNAGNITVNANRFEAINGGQLIARTTSSGAAGKITVNADRRVTVSGRDTNFADRRSQFDNRVFANVIKDAEVVSGLFVLSSASGQAGNIEINSPIVFLDNQGRLDANSNSQPGGNITLNQGNLLLLRRNSLITTSAGTGNGGNIKIKYPKGFIIAGFSRNNDIAANASTGTGGRVDINALGAVNIEALSRKDLERRLQRTKPLDPQRLPSNDITAISQENPNLSGTVNSNAPIVEPTRGTIRLPEDLGDSSKLIANSCPVGVQGAASRFVVTGRGGLPPNPGSALSTDTFLGSAANAPSGKNATASTSIPPQEAQGVEIGPRGEIILTARPSTLTPHTPWQRLRGCYGK